MQISTCTPRRAPDRDRTVPVVFGLEDFELPGREISACSYQGGIRFGGDEMHGTEFALCDVVYEDGEAGLTDPAVGGCGQSIHVSMEWYA